MRRVTWASWPPPRVPSKSPCSSPSPSPFQGSAPLSDLSRMGAPGIIRYLHLQY